MGKKNFFFQKKSFTGEKGEALFKKTSEISIFLPVFSKISENFTL
jgi:hypothetical protein